MHDDWKIHWEEFLTKKFGSEYRPVSFTIDLGEINFYIPPLLGANIEAFKVIQKHNAKKVVF